MHGYVCVYVCVCMWLGTDSKCSVPKPVEEVVRDYTVLRYVMDISFISHIMHTLMYARPYPIYET